MAAYNTSPLLPSTDASSKTTNWVIGLGVASALCVAVTLSASPAVSDAKYTVARPVVSATATGSIPTATLRNNAPHNEQVAYTSGLQAQSNQQASATAAFVRGQTAPSWLPSLMLVPLAGFLAAVVYNVFSKKEVKTGEVMEVSLAAVSGERDMKVWNPIDNQKYETFSYLPLMNDQQIARQVQMIIAKGLSPCLEFAPESGSTVSNDNTVRFCGSAAGYYDNRYWTMWKLPMFGCSDPGQVLHEIAECKRSYPQCYVRLAAFDSIKQVQVVSFMVAKPGASQQPSYSSWAVTGEKETDMQVWNPIDNQKFETFSYLPLMNDQQIARQVQMIIMKGLSPCLEFASEEQSTVSNDNTVRFSGSAAGYYDNRYWTMWKLPMFGCTDPGQVLHEIAECKRAYPQCYVRLAAFDSIKQVQVVSFMVAKPGASSTVYSSWAVTAEKEMEMQVWNPINNQKQETFSYLPLMNDQQIAKQVQMIIAKGLSPCLEFAPEDAAVVSSENTVRFCGSAAGYYDNRYWTMWKLPMFGCTDPGQVLNEVNECKKAFPQCYVRLAAFDSVKQVQVVSFMVAKPGQASGASSYSPSSYSSEPSYGQSTSGWDQPSTPPPEPKVDAWNSWAVTGEKETDMQVWTEDDMQVWNPIDNQKFETFSYLPLMNDQQIARQVQMIIAKGLSPCLEFAPESGATVSNDNTVRFCGSAAGYYDNRYWTMWKLPMFGCSDPGQVLAEIAECKRSYPQCYIRLAAFDSVKQVQVVSFMVSKPGQAGSSSSYGESSYSSQPSYGSQSSYGGQSQGGYGGQSSGGYGGQSSTGGSTSFW